MYIRRAIEKRILEISSTYPVLILTGPRQVGKSTVLQELAERNRNYVTLDSLAMREYARQDPQGFLAEHHAPLIIDEIQYAPELLTWIKIRTDAAQQVGAYWLTGSQQFHLMKGVSESLAGRAGIIHLLGLSLAELEGRSPDRFEVDSRRLSARLKAAMPRTMTECFDLIHQGSMPRVHAQGIEDVATFYDSYVRTYISRDVRDLTQVADETAFFRFMQVVAANTAQLLNLDDWARDADISPNTARQWLSVLTTTGLVLSLQPFHSNALSRLRKAPKLHFMDTGLAAYLTGWSTSTVLRQGAASGAFFETWVIGELYKNLINTTGAPLLLNHYRDYQKNEVDLILRQGLTLHPIEVKKSSTVHFGDTKGISVLRGKLAKTHDAWVQAGRQGSEPFVVGEGCVIYGGEDSMPLGQDDRALPFWAI